ncbi:hypothetical protein GCM10010420_43060 [Streptomyces glaucosporus]|uniref:PIN domain-containing protein n=1 Tax=Streptomyces glaucosporus TaxID=284044 RepID=A0ABN3INF3_9ACTN
MAFVALYDANVLYPSTLRDLLISMAQDGLVQAKWTDRILDETFRNLKAKRPDLDPVRLDRTREAMMRAVRDCMVKGYEPLIEAQPSTPTRSSRTRSTWTRPPCTRRCVGSRTDGRTRRGPCRTCSPRWSETAWSPPRRPCERSDPTREPPAGHRPHDRGHPCPQRTARPRPCPHPRPDRWRAPSPANATGAAPGWGGPGHASADGHLTST